MLFHVVALLLWCCSGCASALTLEVNATAAEQFPAGAETVSSEDKIAILHVGKTGGTYIRTLLGNSVNSSVVHILDHYKSRRWMHWCGAKPNLRFVVFVRSPIQRFVSAWISRFDRDQEGHNPWTKEEEWGFTRFQTPAELACALTNPHAEIQQDARRAMLSSPHLHLDLHTYVGKFLTPKHDCLGKFLFVGRTEHIDADVDRLSTLLKQRRLLQTPPSRQQAFTRQGSDRMRPYRMLNQCAVEGLRKWYRRDYAAIHKFVQAGLLERSYLSDLEQVEAKGWIGLAR